MLTVAKRRKLLLLDSSTLTYAYLKSKSNSLCVRSSTNEIFKERYEFGEFHHLYEKLRLYPDLFKNYTRISIETFDYITTELKKDFSLKTTNFMRPISLEERLILTLR